MAPETESPAVNGRASCDTYAGFPALAARQAQFLIVQHAIRPELAVMLAAVLFGGRGA